MSLEKDSLLHGRYRIEETIAAGGMGAVYGAQDESLKIHVAVKENFFTTDEFSRQFRREATILASLRHPNLPRVTDHFVIPGQGQYLVMDFIEGTDLRELITQNGRLAEDEVVRIGASICDALTYLHTRIPPIVHRDIKPGNLKISPSAVVYLVDFGLAKVSHDEATATGAQGLTPGYAPPEQYGQGTEPRSDIYALGATLYAALTGKIPEDGLSRAMGSAELTPVRKYNPQTSDSVAKAIERAMSVKPGERYPEAEAFKQALLQGKPALQPTFGKSTSRPPAQHEPTMPDKREEAVKQPAISDQKPPAMRKEKAPARRSHALFPALSIGLVVVLLAGAGLYWFGGSLFRPTSAGPGTAALTAPPPPAQTAPATSALLSPAQTQTQEPTAAVQSTPTNGSPTVTESPVPTATAAVPTASATAAPSATPLGGSTGQIAFASDRGGSVQIWLMNADGSDPIQITNVADGACQPDWSPDGKQLVFTSPCAGKKEEYPGSSLFLINADGAGLVPLPSLPGGDFDPAWSPDGQQIAFTSLRDNLPHVYLYNFADKSTRRFSNIVNRERRPAWSPDGQWIAYETTRQGQPQIWMTSIDGKVAKEFSDLNGGTDFMPEWAPDGSVMIYSQGSTQPLLVARQTGDKLAKEFPVAERERPVEDARFSADGWWIAFTSRRDNNTDIYRMQRNGSSLTRLTDSSGLDFHPAWRPAGH